MAQNDAKMAEIGGNGDFLVKNLRKRHGNEKQKQMWDSLLKKYFQNKMFMI